VTLVGVSFAGGLAVVAAGRPTLADKLTGVVSLGGHADLPRVMRYLGGSARREDAPAPHDYGAVIILLAALPRLLPASQVEAADRVVRMFLDASSQQSNDPGAAATAFAAAADAGATLPEPARSLANAVIRRDVTRLGALVEPWIDDLGGAAALSPVKSPAPRVPVFLLHGTGDPVIPSSETVRLAAYLQDQGTPRVRWLITPLLRHADVHDDAPLSDVWRLVVFWREIMTH
jgi:pimeloyl-ACP methyl ester carboxylesterase